jgi:hypothetical protein
LGPSPDWRKIKTAGWRAKPTANAGGRSIRAYGASMQGLLALVAETITYLTTSRWRTFAAALAVLLALWFLLMLTR